MKDARDAGWEEMSEGGGGRGHGTESRFGEDVAGFPSLLRAGVAFTLECASAAAVERKQVLYQGRTLS